MAENCLFCKINQREIPGQIHYEDEHWLAFDDKYPVAPIHVLLVPKTHIVTLEEVDDLNFYLELINTAKKIASQLGISDNYKLFMNVGLKVQAIHHLHLHIYGGWGEEKLAEQLDKESRKLISE